MINSGNRSKSKRAKQRLSKDKVLTKRRWKSTAWEKHWELQFIHIGWRLCLHLSALCLSLCHCATLCVNYTLSHTRPENDISKRHFLHFFHTVLNRTASPSKSSVTFPLGVKNTILSPPLLPPHLTLIYPRRAPSTSPRGSSLCLSNLSMQKWQ